MLNHFTPHRFSPFLGIIAGLLLAVAFSLLAFSEPTQPPPGCTAGTPGCDAPLNAGASTQDKAGWLTFEGGGTRNTTLLATAGGNVGIGVLVPSYKLDVAGTVAAANFAVTGATGGGVVPQGAVMFFNLSSCPFGWSPLVSADGRYIVGRTSGGVGITAGTALTSGENRAVGRHTHGVTDPQHSHGIRKGTSGPGSGIVPDPFYGVVAVTTEPASTGISIQDAGSVDGTNAPYLQLLVCQKD